MATLEERVSRLEGVVEQINERLADIQAQLEGIRADLRDLRAQKADKWELRLWAVTILAFQAVLAGLLGAVLARLP